MYTSLHLEKKGARRVTDEISTNHSVCSASAVVSLTIYAPTTNIIVRWKREFIAERRAMQVLVQFLWTSSCHGCSGERCTTRGEAFLSVMLM